MTLVEIQNNIDQKIVDAELLNEHGSYANSIYLCGYCVELSLKKAITKHLKRNEYPISGNFKFLKTHDLELLVALTGKEPQIKKMAEWSIVSKWTEHQRYAVPSDTDKTDSDLMLIATKKIMAVV